MTAEDVATLLDGALPAILEHLEAALSPLRARLDAIEATLAIVTERGLQYRGVYTQGDLYTTGDAVTRAGSLWICRAPNIRSVPGTHAAWTLAVKRGQDGKDATITRTDTAPKD